MGVELHQVPGKSRSDWDQHYASGITPWDTQITPPEVKLFWRHHVCRPGNLAIDLGCGTGTNLNYLRSLGLQVIGVDLSGLALSRAQLKLGSRYAAGRLFLADVCRLPFHGLDASYILDIGCLHGIPRHLRDAYAQGVVDNLCSGGYYHLFAFDRADACSVGDNREETARSERGMLPDEVASIFAPHLTVTSIIYGRPSRYTCRWYLLRKS